MVGRSIKSIIESGLLPKQDATVLPANTPVSVKEAVLPFKRFATREGRFVDSLLGPEMRSTGEVMGIDTNFPSSFAKSQAAAGSSIPLSGTVFISVADRDKPQIVLPVRRLAQLGYRILATEGTSKMLRRHGIASETVAKYSQASGQRSIVEMITDGEVDVVVNTPSGADARSDGYEIRAATTAADKPIFTTVAQLAAAIGSFEIIREGGFSVTPLQVHARFRETADA
jgi:carbamoyl-phosphate synthase large subunit